MHLAFDPEEDSGPEGSAAAAAGDAPSPRAAGPGTCGSLVRTLCMRRSDSLLSMATADGSLEEGEGKPFERQESVGSLGSGAGNGAGCDGAEAPTGTPAGPVAPLAAIGSPRRPSSRERQHHRRWPSTVPEEAAEEGVITGDAPVDQQQRLESVDSKASDGSYSLGAGPEHGRTRLSDGPDLEAGLASSHDSTNG